jgi:hypothetical protein
MSAQTKQSMINEANMVPLARGASESLLTQATIELDYSRVLV